MKKIIVLYTMILGFAFFANPPLLTAQENDQSEQVTVESGVDQDPDEVPQSILDPEHIEEHGQTICQSIVLPW